MKHSLRIALATLVLALGAGHAAALELTLAFDRSVAHPGDSVTLSGSVKNVDELAVFAYMQVTVRLNGQVVSAFAGRIPVESDETIYSSINFGVPSLLPGGVVTVVFFSIWGKHFGKADLGKIVGAAQALTVLASAAGPIVFAASAEHMHSYTPAFLLMAPLLLAGGVACLIVKAP